MVSSAARQRMRNIGAACTTARMRSSSWRARVGAGLRRRRVAPDASRAWAAALRLRPLRAGSLLLGGRLAQHRGPEPAARATSLVTVTSPPIIWQKRRLIARPRPVPPYLRVVEASAWVKALEQPAELLGRHADAGVGARGTPRASPAVAVASRRTCERDRAVLGELGGVAQQVEQDLAQLVRSACMLAEVGRRSRRSSALPFFSTSGWTVARTSSTSVGTVERSRGTAPSSRPRSSTGRGCR